MEPMTSTSGINNAVMSDCRLDMWPLKACLDISSSNYLLYFCGVIHRFNARCGLNASLKADMAHVFLD